MATVMKYGIRPLLHYFRINFVILGQREPAWFKIIQQCSMFCLMYSPNFANSLPFIGPFSYIVDNSDNIFKDSLFLTHITRWQRLPMQPPVCPDSMWGLLSHQCLKSCKSSRHWPSSISIQPRAVFPFYVIFTYKFDNNTEHFYCCSSFISRFAKQHVLLNFIFCNLLYVSN